MGVKENIRKIIDAHPNLTVRNVSLAAGLSDSALHKFLTRPDQSMSVANLEKVAGILGVQPSALFTEGTDGHLPSEDDLREWVSAALLEVPPETPLSGYSRIVASSLHDRLALLLKHGASPGSVGALTAPDISALPPVPTRGRGQAKPRNP